MRCPFCAHEDTIVKDSRTTDDQLSIRRRRYCAACSSRFTTYERIQLRELMVVKKDGVVEPFNRDKLTRSITTAMRKRPIDAEQIERMISSIVRQLETCGEGEIPTTMIGTKVMEALYDLDPVAYVRFASVYMDFQDVKDFVEFIGRMSREYPAAQ